MVKITNVTFYFNLEEEEDYTKYMECIKELNKYKVDFDMIIKGNINMITYKITESQEVGYVQLYLGLQES